MAVMATGIGLPQSRPLTADDVELMPDDGQRYELIDGTLLVTPAPGSGHQEVQHVLTDLLRRLPVPVVPAELVRDLRPD